MKVLCYGMQEAEIPIFEEANKGYNFDLHFTKELLNKKNVEDVKGYDALVLFVNCDASKEVLQKIKSLGVKYIVTRTAGFNHIDLDEATKLGYTICRVPQYSPTAIASLAFAGGLSLLRKIPYIYDQTKKGNFKIDSQMFAKEAKNSTIGILGTGKIGFETAKMWKGMGSKVIAYDPYENEAAKQILDYTTFDNVISQSDLISIHMPYFKGKNDDIINADVIKNMKKGAILVNSSRAELVSLPAVIASLKADHLGGYATDVFPNEAEIINNNFNNKFPENLKVIEELISLYPKTLVSPHVAYFTDEAIKNMAETSFKNLDQLIKTNSCENKIN
ncbi:D-lactate dehydrogenase [Entomoplasma freundtii]|uniref:Lactate dehydrogenase n=1 Tax=Entomoplasma freundtii TaxID=74700 RepID=A0A2K8NUH3_9MOLU|nr:NAD(P)-dependent oxidoreductase [Entomoplasma freundtii]ATZ16273.1 lactate dehydrogenase [Entomoplasma freundtii]TDY56826.1 D-lactate dehydrogenase [Entomoplasma freundtii]